MEKIRGFEIAKGFEEKGINLPIRKTKYSAGYDIEAAEDVTIPSFKNRNKSIYERRRSTNVIQQKFKPKEKRTNTSQ